MNSVQNNIPKRHCKLVSFNCKSIKRSINYVKELCATADVIALQETWLLSHDLAYLGSIYPGFASTGVCATESTEVVRGRPYGGVAILWRSSAFDNVSVIKCSNVRLTAIKAVVDNRDILIFSVYMPVCNLSNLIEYTECLAEINAIVECNCVENVFVLGDFNAHPGELFCTELLKFCYDYHFTCADIDMLGINSNTFTYMSDSHGCVRWLDHCLVTSVTKGSIVKVNVINDVSWSDHFPLEITCNFNVLVPKYVKTNKMPNKVIWGTRTPEQIQHYSQLCHRALRDIDFPSEFIECSDKICKNEQHKLLIDSMYKQIVTVLQEAASLSNSTIVRKNKRVVTGWNKHVKEAHQRARLGFQRWVLVGKPMSGEVYNEMKESRKIFKSKLKFCQNNERQIKMDIIATLHEEKKFSTFWKHTNALNPQLSLPVNVEGFSNNSDIANMFMHNFKMDPLTTSTSVRGTRTPCEGDTHARFSIKEIKTILSNMKRGRSPGHDGLSVEHLRCAGVHLPRILCMLFNFCISHCYLPEDLLKTVVVPVVKNKTGDSSDKNNYRPISLAKVIGKVLDSLLEKQLNRHIKLNDAQFGFRPGLSTESAILCLKQTVRYYTDRRTPVYGCFLDLSKAFDLVNYDILWQKLLDDTDLPAELINVFQHWYKNQKNYVKWADTKSQSYGLECGVRQGGITSPSLFNLYIDRLVGELSGTMVGCSIDGKMLNNISYADDMVLLSPSICGLRKLLAVCERYAEAHGLRYNATKSEVIVFKVRNNTPAYIPPVKLRDSPLKVVTQFKYLGHVVTDSLTDDQDIDRERRALAARCNMLARRFARCTNQVKLTLFRAYCQSFYSCSLWVKYTQKAYNALRVQYNNALRMLLGLPRYCSASGMFAEHRVDDFYAIIRKRCASAMRRFRDSPNSILATLADKIDGPFIRHWASRHLRPDVHVNN